MIKKLDWYIIQKFLVTFVFLTLIMAAISCVIDYSEKADDFVKHRAPLLEVLNYFKNFIPYISALLYPFFVFIATIFFTSRLAYKTEIIAILASGVSFQRFLRPYAIGATILGILSLLFNHWIVPAANKARLRFEDKYVHEARMYSDENTHLRLSKHTYIFVRDYNYANNMGTTFEADSINGTELLEKITADRISYDSVKKEWTLYNVSVRHNMQLKEDYAFHYELKKKFAFTPRDLRSDDEKMFAMTTWQLNRFIDLQRTRSAENLNTFYVEKHRRTAQPFSVFILTIIGACISNRKVRGGSGFHLAVGIALSVVCVMLQQFSNTFSTNAGLNPMIAVWIPNIIFGIVAIVLYRREIK